MEEYLVRDIGFPPDSSKARKISQDLNVDIRYRFQNVNWASSENFPVIEEISNYKEYVGNGKDKKIFSFSHDDIIYSITNIPDGIIILSYYNPKEIFNFEKVILTIVILLSIIFIPLYFLLRWLLNPIKSLSLAVKQISEGNYDVELPVGRSDELGDLAKSLKNMSSKVKDSIRAKEQLLIDVSHELRTPLTRIKFGLELETPKEKINEDVIEIENMISKILDYYRNEYYFLQLNLSETDLIVLIENLISSFDLQKNRIDFINYATGKNEIIIKADEDKLKTAFGNLISNALKFSPENKNVIICINESEKYYEITFKDFGEGIKEDEKYKIFEPFARIDSSRSKKTGGYGLGLAIVKKIIDLHNAVIEVRSKENEGTEMIIKFKKWNYYYDTN
ncbi:MAG: HAMP domain-containing sensor histidine kinase [Ignavibacteria bacterium]